LNCDNFLAKWDRIIDSSGTGWLLLESIEFVFSSLPNAVAPIAYEPSFVG
jgi:hypothetical protein